jgi:hypothetical protein
MRCWIADNHIPRVEGRRHAAQPPRILRFGPNSSTPAACLAVLLSDCRLSRRRQTVSTDELP